MFKVQEISKKYGDKIIIDKLSYKFEKGKIIGFLGPNGAGKTTVIRMLNLITKPDSGNISFEGRTFTAKDLANIGYMPEEKGLYPNMFVREQLVYIGRLHGLTFKEARTKSDFWLNKFAMSGYAKVKQSALSKGNAQKIQFIATVLHDPEILILDEPLSGLDPINSKLINDTILEFKQAGKTIIFSTHRMEQVEELCDQIILINNGRKIAEGKLSDLQKQYDTRRIELILEKDYHEPDFASLGLDIKQVSGNTIHISLKPDQSFNQLLSYCIARSITLKSFKKLLPSAQEIFINLVNQY
jgi:ABC-2 type transport system ATP-binding protein